MSAICFPSVEKILKMERAEPTDSCEAILAPLRYARGRGAAVLLKSDPLPDILQYCSEHRVHFRDAVFSSKMRDVATTCGPKYVVDNGPGYVDTRVTSYVCVYIVNCITL